MAHRAAAENPAAAVAQPAGHIPPDAHVAYRTVAGNLAALEPATAGDTEANAYVAHPAIAENHAVVGVRPVVDTADDRDQTNLAIHSPGHPQKGISEISGHFQHAELARDLAGKIACATLGKQTEGAHGAYLQQVQTGIIGRGGITSQDLAQVAFD